MASAGASLERRLERLETAYRARRQPQITVVRLVDEEPSDDLAQRDDVLVIQRVLVAPPESYRGAAGTTGACNPIH